MAEDQVVKRVYPSESYLAEPVFQLEGESIASSLPVSTQGYWYRLHIIGAKTRKHTLYLADPTAVDLGTYRYEERFDGKVVDSFCGNWDLLLDFKLSFIGIAFPVGVVASADMQACTVKNYECNGGGKFLMACPSTLRWNLSIRYQDASILLVNNEEYGRTKSW
jgi:hypothetical protein